MKRNTYKRETEHVGFRETVSVMDSLRKWATAHGLDLSGAIRMAIRTFLRNK
jgi:hypothetical protein